MTSSEIIYEGTTQAHRARVRKLLEAAFGRSDEAELVDALDDGGYVLCSLVACDEGRVIGHVAFSTLIVEQAEGVVRAAALAPLAVAEDQRGKGIGSELVRRGLVGSGRLGCDAVIVLGDPAFYGRFGFSSELGARLSCPFGGPCFMALELLPASLSRGGRVIYPPPFGL